MHASCKGGPRFIYYFSVILTRMGRFKVNERGTHTSAIEGAKDVLKILKKLGVTTSPGVIQANVGGRGKSVKLKKVNNETFEMVIVVNSSKQTFKIYGGDHGKVTRAIAGLRLENWNVQDVLDISETQ